jgi:TonB family protein
MKTLFTLCSLLFLAPFGMRAAESDAPADGSGRVIQTVQPRFPQSMIHHAVRHGNVRMLLEITPEGRLSDALVTAFTREEFAEEARRVVQLWRYEPARVDGQPVTTIINLSFRFELEGVLIVAPTVSDTAEARARREQFEYEAKELRQIDRIPTPVKVVAPAYSLDLARRGTDGKIAVDFYIDETGHVRMASCPPGTNEQLASLALSAVKGWVFTPPTSSGRPVLVKARQVFDFVPAAAPNGT